MADFDFSLPPAAPVPERGPSRGWRLLFLVQGVCVVFLACWLPWRLSRGAGAAGSGAVAGGGMPDLRYSPYLAAAEAFRRPPLDGVLATRGMPAFSDSLQAAEVDAIRAYVIRMAHSFAPQADAPEAAAQ